MNYLSRNKKKQIFLSVGVLFLFLTTNVYAEGASLKVFPSNLQIRAQAPADVRAPLRIVNNTGNAVDLKIIVKAIKQSEKEDGEPIFVKPSLLDERLQDTFLQTVQILDDGFAINTLSLAPKQEKKLNISISVSKNLPPEDHYFSIVFLTNPKPSNITYKLTDKETRSLVQAGISIPVLLSLGTSQEQVGFIDEFSVPFFLQSGPVPFSVKVKNSGTHFISPKGMILIKNFFGQTIGKIDLPMTNVLAGTSRYLSNGEVISAAAAEKGREVKPTPKAVWKERILFGFYTATLSITMSNNDILYTRSVYFTAFPFTALIVIFLFIYFSFLIIKRVRKKLAEE